MKLLISSLFKESRFLFTFSILSSAASGSLTFFLVIQLASHVEGSPITLRWWAFASILFANLLLQLAGVLSARELSTRICKRFRLEILDSAVGTPLESISSAHDTLIETALSDDLQKLETSAPALFGIPRHAIFLICCLLYDIRQSTFAFFLTISLILASTILYCFLQTRIRYLLRRIRELTNELLESIRKAVEGTKELKISRDRRQRLRDIFHRRTALLVAANRRASFLFVTSSNITTLTLFAAFFVSAYLLPYDYSENFRASYFLLLIFALGHVQGVIGILDQLLPAQLGISELSRLINRLRPHLESSDSFDVHTSPLPPLLSLSFLDLRFQYNIGNDPFSVGPITKTIYPGDALFITGKNGSGKTTLLKTIIGLYKPASGSISLNNTLVTATNLYWYREHFGGVFSNYSVLSELEKNLASSQATDVYQICKRFGIERIFTEERMLGQSAIRLSAGELRRLALLHAWLDDKPIYFFDEFASDQDAQYKELFYSDILDDLRRRKKIVIVVAHDERYFSRGSMRVDLIRGRPPRWVDSP